MPILYLTLVLAGTAAWVTHVVACIAASAWFLLVIGLLVPPVGWVHGAGIWFGIF